mgnify:FL=1
MQYVFGYVKIPVKEIVSINRGKRVVRSQLKAEDAYPVYQNSMTPLGFYDVANCKGDTTFVIAAGAAGEIGYSSTDFWAADDCYYFDCDANLESKYLYYALKNQQGRLFSQVRKASIPRLSKTAIENMVLEIPEISKQKEIVAILDRFDTLCNDLTTGLPAEIEARQKQYEYYRDKLLTFKELGA